MNFCCPEFSQSSTPRSMGGPVYTSWRLDVPYPPSLTLPPQLLTWEPLGGGLGGGVARICYCGLFVSSTIDPRPLLRFSHCHLSKYIFDIPSLFLPSVHTGGAPRRDSSTDIVLLESLFLPSHDRPTGDSKTPCPALQLRVQVGSDRRQQ